MTYTDIHEALAAYDDMLDQTTGNGEVSIAGYAFQVHRAFKALDPTAYRVGFHDFLDAGGIDMDELQGWDEAEL